MNVTRSLFCFIIFALLFVGCTHQIPSSENTDVSENAEEVEFDVAYTQAVHKLDTFFTSGKKFKCVLENNLPGRKHIQILYIDNENYRGEGYLEDLQTDINASSFITGKRYDNGKYCTYLWTIGKNINEKGSMACDPNFHPAHPFKIDDLVQGAFYGVSVELVNTCRQYQGEIMYEPPTNIQTNLIDWSALGAARNVKKV